MRDKRLWALSQVASSFYFFLLQLTFLKNYSIDLVAQFSSLTSIGAFVLLAYRRCFLEIRAIESWQNNRSPLLEIFSFYLVMSLAVTFFFKWDLFLTLYIILLFLNLALMDQFKFIDQKGHQFYSVIHLFLIATILLESRYFRGWHLLLMTNIIISFVSYAIKNYTNNVKINHLSFRSSSFNLHKLQDLVLTSLIGFISPIVVFIIIDAQAVAVLRTSQNILSIANIFTTSIYYGALSERNQDFRFRWLYVTPTIFISSFVLMLTVNPKSSLTLFFGPYFQDSVTLTLLMALNLAFSIWTSVQVVHLTKLRLYKEILHVHLWVAIINILSIIILLSIVGILGFALAGIIINILEVILLLKKIRIVK